MHTVYVCVCAVEVFSLMCVWVTHQSRGCVCEGYTACVPYSPWAPWAQHAVDWEHIGPVCSLHSPTTHTHTETQHNTDINITFIFGKIFWLNIVAVWKSIWISSFCYHFNIYFAEMFFFNLSKIVPGNYFICNCF